MFFIQTIGPKSIKHVHCFPGGGVVGEWWKITLTKESGGIATNNEYYIFILRTRQVQMYSGFVLERKKNRKNIIF